MADDDDFDYGSDPFDFYRPAAPRPARGDLPSPIPVGFEDLTLCTKGANCEARFPVYPETHFLCAATGCGRPTEC